MLKQLTIVEYTAGGPVTTDITADVGTCKTGVAAGDPCRLVAETAPADGGVADGGTLAAADPALCLLGAADWCRCQGDPTASDFSTWTCDPFAPTSFVIATFDRLIDTAPFEPDAGVPADEIASLTTSPAAQVEPVVDYSSTGSDSSIVFKLYGPNWGNFVTGNPLDNYYRSFGPSIQILGTPALPTGATISIDLSKTNVRAKDGKTPFTGDSVFLKDGSLKFKTAAFTASITTPFGEDLPPPDPDAGAGPSDASAPDGGVADATPPPPAPTTGPVPADMNMAPVTIVFNNAVPPTASNHFKVTADGVLLVAGTDYTIVSEETPATVSAPITTFKFTLTPTASWAEGKTYVVTIDANAADVLGTKLGAPISVAFMMAN